MKLQKSKIGVYFVNLPRQIIRAKGWDKGDKIEAKIDEKGNIRLMKVESFQAIAQQINLKKRIFIKELFLSQ